MMEWLQLAERLAALSFPTLLVLILIANRWKVWVWGRELDEKNEAHAKELAAEIRRTKEAEERCAALMTMRDQRAEEWKELALTGAITTREAVSIVKKRGGL